MKQIENRLPDIIWYYCNQQVFKSIVENHEIWLSDITKSNDANEIESGLKFAKESFKTEAEKYFQEMQDDDVKNSVINFYIREIDKAKKMFYWFAMCFSNKENNLIHWRTYGDNGKGYAIGFDRRALKQLVNTLAQGNMRSISMDKVKYVFPLQNRESQADCPKDERVNFINCINENLCSDLLALKGGVVNQNNVLYDKVKYMIRNSILEIIKSNAFYKDSDFSAESEIRLCYSRYIDYKRLKSGSIPKTSLLSSLDFIFKNGEIISHVILKLERIQDYIKEVYVGPDNNTDIQTLYAFLAKNGGFMDNENSSDKNVIVRKSQISCR